MAHTPMFGLNIDNPRSHSLVTRAPARIAFFSMAGDGGCLSSLADDSRLKSMLGMFDLAYWPCLGYVDEDCDYDIAVVEGAVLSREQALHLVAIRERAKVVIAVGACALTGGIFGLLPQSADGYDGHPLPCRVSDIISVDFVVPGCPLEPGEFIAVLQRALLGMSPYGNRMTMCASCKMEENICVISKGQICLGLIAISGCKATCVSKGRTCDACRGISPDTNRETASSFLEEHGIPSEDIARRIELYCGMTLRDEEVVDR